MAFKDFRTRRSLRLELENRIETIDRRNKTIEELTAKCNALNSNNELWKKKANTCERVINELTLENAELKRKLKALETPESEAFNFECMGVSNVN
jgi:hypothetical protein